MSARGPVTEGVTLSGRTLLSRVFHVNLHRVVDRVSQAVVDNVGESSHVVARAAVRWVSLFVRNFEMTLYWGLAWALAHVLLVVVGGDILGQGRPPLALALAADGLPGVMFGISIARLVVAMTRVRQVDVFGGAPSSRALTAGERPRGWLLLRLLEPTDLDIVVVVVALVIVGLLSPR